MKYPDEKEVFKQFGERIVELRGKHKLSQSALAGKAEIEKSSVQRLEKGSNVTLKTMIQLANAFDITLTELIELNNNEKTIEKK